MPAANTAPDLSAWPTRHEAAHLLVVSIATVDRWIAAGRIQTAKRPRPAKKPEIVCSPADVEALAPRHAQPAYDAPLALAPRPAPAADPLALIAAIAGALQPPREPREPEQFLTLEQAAQTTGLTAGYLRRQIREGKLPAVRDGRTKVRRSDLARL